MGRARSIAVKTAASSLLVLTIGTALVVQNNVKNTAIMTPIQPHTPSLVDSLLLSANIQPQHSSSSASLLYRKCEVFAIATRVFSDYKVLQWRCDQIDSDTPEGEALVNQMWEDAHTRNARFLYRKFSSLKALWIKLGQYLSSRADIMPTAFLSELSKCQDSLPPIPFPEIKAIIEEELRLGSIDDMFSYVNEEPLAVASIASVHEAILKDSGRKVVIKVQHKEVRDQLLQDLKCLETIGDMVRYLDPDFDFSPVVREWAREVPKELDFRREADNMQRVASNLAPHYGKGIDIRLAELVAPELISEKVLVMSFIDGFKIDNRDLLDKHGVDREAAVLHITRAYAHQIFVDGFYSADPHPGNILVSADTKMPILLDFGLTKELSDELRYHFARMIVAADEQDIAGLLGSLENIGLRLRTDQPFDLNLLVKYFFREAKPADEAKEENKERRKEWKDKEEERKKSLYKGDRVDVTSRNLLGLRSTRRGEVLDVGKGQLLVRLASGEETSVSIDSAKLQKSRSPIDSWPDAFIFFERVLGLLRGLTASLAVRNSYLDSMTPYARLALSRHPKSSAVNTAARGLDTLSVSSAIDEVIADGSVLGCQVCVEVDGRAVVDLCGGKLDPYHSFPVAPDSVFCGFSVSKGIAAAAVHLLAEEGRIDIDAPIASYWPAFAAGGKEGITLGDVLSHRAGMQDAGTSEVAADPFLVCDAEAMRDLMAAYEINRPTATHDKGIVSYHYLSFGWILDGAVFHATGKDLRQVVEERIGSRLGLSGELQLGLAEDVAEGRVANLVLKRFELPSPSSSTPPTASPTASPIRPPSGPSLLLNPTFFNNPRIRSAGSLASANGHFSARALAKFYSSLCTDQLFPGRKRGLADILRENVQRSRAAAEAIGGEAKDEGLLQGGTGRFFAGFMMYPSSVPPHMAAAAAAAAGAAGAGAAGAGAGVHMGTGRPEARSLLGSLRAIVAPRLNPPRGPASTVTFGHSGLGGSVALVSCDLASGRRVSVAVTVNRLSMDSAATRRIVRHVYTQLNMPVPLAFQK